MSNRNRVGPRCGESCWHASIVWAEGLLLPFKQQNDVRVRFAPNQVWTGDINFIATDEGSLYWVIVIDLFRPQPDDGLIVRSDRIGQYGGHEFQSTLERHQMKSSMNYASSGRQTSMDCNHALTTSALPSIFTSPRVSASSYLNFPHHNHGLTQLKRSNDECAYNSIC